jgi:hypothetical protein
VVAHRHETRAIRSHANGGEAAEFLEVRCELEPAAEFEQTEIPPRRIGMRKSGERLCLDRDGGGWLGRPRRTGRIRDRERDQNRSQHAAGPAARSGRTRCRVDHAHAG